MKLVLGAAVKNRAFGKAIRKVWSKFDGMKEGFSKVALVNPIYDAMVVGFTDDRPAGHFERVPSREAVYQVVVGLGEFVEDVDLVSLVLSGLHLALEDCGLSPPDRKSAEIVFQKWRHTIQSVAP